MVRQVSDGSGSTLMLSISHFVLTISILFTVGNKFPAKFFRYIVHLLFQHYESLRDSVLLMMAVAISVATSVPEPIASYRSKDSRHQVTGLVV